MVIWRQTFRIPAFLLFLPLLLPLLACSEGTPTPRPAPTPTSEVPYWENSVANYRSRLDNSIRQKDADKEALAVAEAQYKEALKAEEEKYAATGKLGDDLFAESLTDIYSETIKESDKTDEISENADELEEDYAEDINLIEGLEAENREKSREIYRRELDAQEETKDLEKRLEALVDELTPGIVAELNLEIENRHTALEKRRSNLPGQIAVLDAEAAKEETSVSQLRQQVRTAEAGRHTAEFELKELTASTELCRTKLSSLIEAMESIRDRARGLALSTGVSGFSHEMKTLLAAFPEECLATTEG